MCNRAETINQEERAVHSFGCSSVELSKLQAPEFNSTIIIISIIFIVFFNKSLNNFLLLRLGRWETKRSRKARLTGTGLRPTSHETRERLTVIDGELREKQVISQSCLRLPVVGIVR